MPLKDTLDFTMADVFTLNIKGKEWELIFDDDGKTRLVCVEPVRLTLPPKIIEKINNHGRKL